MALGKKLFQIDFQDWIKGMSTSDDLPDAGYSPNTDQVQLTKVPGVVYAPAQGSDASTNLTGQMIASTEDPTGHYDRLFISTSVPDGRFYSFTSGVLTSRGSTDSTRQYVQGKTDFTAFQGEAYFTTASTLGQWTGIGAANTIDPAFFAFTYDASSTALSAPHPLLNYNNFLYMGDGNTLKRKTAAGAGAPTVILTFPTGWIIVALGIDPGSGLMLISVIGQVNLSDQINSSASVVFYNGASSSYQRIVQVDDMITAFPCTEGALYAAYGQNLGLWNGSGVTFLRKMNLAFLNTKLMYKQHFSSIGSTLYFIENHKIIALGPIRQRGENVFYSAFANTPAGVAVDLTHIANVGQNVMAYSYATSQFWLWDSSSISTSNTQDLYSNVYEFDNEYWIRWIRVVWKAQVSNNADPGSLRILDQDGIVTSVNPTLAGLLDLKNTSGASSAIKDLLNVNARLKQAQLEVLTDTVNPGIRRIIVYGEIADRPN